MSLLSPQLEAFMAIVKHKTVHGAAAEVYLSQTAVTQRIRALENSLKTTLFIRSRKGMLLTTEGEALLRYCQASITLEGEAMAVIQGAATEAEVTVRINGPTSIMNSRIIPSTLPVTKLFPNLLMQYNVEDNDKHNLSLKAGQCDFAIISEEKLMPEMQYKKLKPEQYVLVAPKKWAKRELKDIIKEERIIDFSSEDQVTFNYLKKYNLFKYVNMSRHFANRTDDLAFMVSKGMGYTTLTVEFAQKYIDSGELVYLNTKKTYDLTPVLVWYYRPEMPQYFAKLIDSIN